MRSTLIEDLYSIDGVLLVEKGVKITGKTLNEVVRKRKKICYVSLKNTWITKDIKKALKDEPYEIIFSPESINKKIISTLKKSSIPEDALKELKNIKRNLPYTYHHILVVTALAMKLSLDKHLKDSFDAKIVPRIGFAHDIGKSRIPLKILYKTTPLTTKEFKEIKMHPLIGYTLMHYYYGKDHSKYDKASYGHHERLDGSGYPRGIKEMNKYSQMIAVIDSLDALVSIRPYRKAPYTIRAAIDHLIENARKGKLNKKIVHI
ncbi:MAG: HD domain-containing protein, partial [Candidatus Omnitrophica bacterium]|nr:HD domain-containing protein [Candidatus Omnitrophota bacterium]